ncbi:hypothetical protein FACS1894110_25480 [Spirochaetia bacterium]|nr:hypothetical protein FACS1894110_25480 [Spirochaetia bacterium]
MEKIIFSSPKKYKILEIKRLLSENNIPITSIKLYIYVNMTRHHKGGTIIDEREKRDELIVPIEEFTEKLNDAETFEIYTEENYVDIAINLIEDFNDKNIYNDCIFQSKNYEEAFDIQRILIKNEIPCDDVITNFLCDDTEEYLIFLDPEFHEKAENIIKNNYKQEVPLEKEGDIKQNENNIFSENNEWMNSFMTFLKILFIILIMLILAFFVDKKYPFLEKIINQIIESLKQ